jgi:hypothetical protein
LAQLIDGWERKKISKFYFICNFVRNTVILTSYVIAFVQDFDKFVGLTKLKGAKDVCVCMLCFRNEKTELSKCLFSTHNLSPSNLGKHIESMHSAKDAPDYFKSTSAGPGKAARIPDSRDTASRTTEVTNSNSTIKTYFNNLTSQEAFDLWSRKTHKFFNRCGIPFRSASSNEFRELMAFTVEHASNLKKHQDRLIVGHHRFSQLSKKRLEELVFVVSSLVNDSAQYFVTAIGKNVPRLCVSHDIWESKNGHWLGVTLFMVDVGNWEMVSIPIGFRRSKGKKAKEIFDQVKEIIERYVFLFIVSIVFFFSNTVLDLVFLLTMFTGQSVTILLLPYQQVG